MPPSRRRERRTIVPGMHTVDITSGQDQYLGAPKGSRAPKPQPGALPAANPAAAVTRHEVGPMTGGLAPKPSRPETTQETKRGPVDKIEQSRLWKMFFGPDGQGGGPQTTPVGPGPGGDVPDMTVLPAGSLQYKDALSGRTVIIGPRATEAEISRGGTPTPGTQFGESAVTMKDGRMTLTGPPAGEPPQAPEAAAAAPAEEAPPLSKKELADIGAAFDAVRTAEEEFRLYESYVEKFGDRFLKSSKGRELDEAMAIRGEIYDARAKEKGVKAAAAAQKQLEARQRRQQTAIKGIAGIYTRKAEEVKNPEELAALRAEMRDTAALRGLVVTDEDFDRAGFTAPTEKQMATATWGPVVKQANRSLAGQKTQKGATPEKLQEEFVRLTKGMPAEFRNTVLIPRFGKKKLGPSHVSISDAEGLARNLIAGGKQSSEWEVKIENRPSTEFVTRKQFIDTYDTVTDDAAARNLFMLGSTIEGKVPEGGDTIAYPGLLKAYKAFEKQLVGWSPTHTKQAWLKILREQDGAMGERAKMWQQWKGHTSKEWADAKLADTAEATIERRGASDAGAQAAGKAAAAAAAAAGRAGGKPKPTPEQMREAFEATKSKQEARELLRKQGFDI